MGSQDVFKGALGWDDWIWWSGIGGVGLFFLMVILCCIVCVQRAKRKGRDEAMAVVQARERERQQQEQAELRYAQAQQNRYPAREPSYKFSKPEQPTYNPYGHDDHQMHRNTYAQAPVPRPKPRRGSQQPLVDQEMGQQQQQQQTLYSIPRREESAPPQPLEIQVQAPQELPQVAAYYGRSSQKNEIQEVQVSPKMSQQYQRQQQVHPQQPPIMQYRRVSSGQYRGDINSSITQDDDVQRNSDVPFVQVNSPRNSNASTVSTTYSGVAPSSSLPAASAMGYSNRPGPGSVASSMGRPSVSGGTLRDRIDALREGTPQDNFTRISMSSLSSGAPSTLPSPPSAAPPPQKYSAPPQPSRLSQVMSGTMLSDSSYGTDDGTFDEDAFGTARSAQAVRLVREDSDGSVGSGGQFDDPETPPHRAIDVSPSNRRDRTGTGDSTGSIEF